MNQIQPVCQPVSASEEEVVRYLRELGLRAGTSTFEELDPLDVFPPLDWLGPDGH